MKSIAVKVLNRIGLGTRRQFKLGLQRAYEAARITRLNIDFTPGTETADAALRNDIRILIDRSRAHDRENDYARKYYGALENNILGANGIRLEMRILDPDGTPDQMANKIVETAFKRWGQKGICTANGEESWCDVQRMVLRATARDGGILIRKIVDESVNEFGFALHLMEIDNLDLCYNTVIAGGPRQGDYVFMGVQKEPRYRRVVGYWILDVPPGEQIIGARSQYRRRFVPASEMIHYFIKERPNQSIGVPWLVSSIERLNHLKQYEEAELRAAREAANKGGFWQSDRGDQFPGQKELDSSQDERERENVYNDFEPSSFDQVPAGMTFTPYDPKHPTDAFDPFVKAQLMGVAAGGEMSYATLTGDLTNANFASMRGGSVEEREGWKKRQGHMVEHVHFDVFPLFLQMGLMGGAIPLPAAKFEKFNNAVFRGRRWQWFDPSKDVASSLAAIDGGLTTHSAVIAEHFDADYEDTIDLLAYEQKYRKQKGVEVVTAQKPAAQQAEMAVSAES